MRQVETRLGPPRHSTARWTIGRKLGWCLASLGFLLAAVSIASLLTLSQLRSTLENTANRETQRLLLASSINKQTAALRASVRAMILDAALDQANDLKKDREAFYRQGKEIEEQIAKLQPLLHRNW